jgi:hypothetical protein
MIRSEKLMVNLGDVQVFAASPLLSSESTPSRLI